MLNKNTVKQLVSDTEISQKDKVLILLSLESLDPKEVKEITTSAVECGFTNIKKLNISSILSRQKGLCLRTSNGWELTDKGKSHIRSLSGGPIVELSNSLRNELQKISNLQSRQFVEEAVQCFESHLYRAAVVLSWVGAISVLYEYVISKKLIEFNKAATLKYPKWKHAINADGLARMKEANFLEVCESASIIGKSVKQELQTCLTFRNGCGQP